MPDVRIKNFTLKQMRIRKVCDSVLYNGKSKSKVVKEFYKSKYREKIHG